MFMLYMEKYMGASYIYKLYILIYIYFSWTLKAALALGSLQ